jgi:hypothetical protein
MTHSRKIFNGLIQFPLGEYIRRVDLQAKAEYKILDQGVHETNQTGDS